MGQQVAEALDVGADRRVVESEFLATRRPVHFEELGLQRGDLLLPMLDSVGHVGDGETAGLQGVVQVLQALAGLADLGFERLALAAGLLGPQTDFVVHQVDQGSDVLGGEHDVPDAVGDGALGGLAVEQLPVASMGSDLEPLLAAVVVNRAALGGMADQGRAALRTEDQTGEQVGETKSPRMGLGEAPLGDDLLDGLEVLGGDEGIVFPAAQNQA